MDASDLPETRAALTKAIKNNEIEKALDILDLLATLSITTELLKKTRIGVLLTELRKHENSTRQIQNCCRVLVQKWKADIKLQSQSPSSPSNHVSQQSRSSHPGDTISNGSDSTQTIVERNVNTDQIFIKQGDKIRKKCAEMLYSALATGSTQSSAIIHKVAVQIEEAVWKLGYESYKSKIRSLVFNLRDKCNPELKYRVISGDIKLTEFASMTPDQLMSKDKKAEVAEVQKANMADAIAPKVMHSETDIFKCGKCKKRKATYFQMQTRSADEPMTTFVTCLNCDNRWKFC